MKKLLFATLTLFHLLILPAFSSRCLAQTAQVGYTIEPMSGRGAGVLGIEFGPARLTAGSLGEGAFDLLARSKDGLYFGVGLFSEVAGDTTYESDTTTTTTTGPGKRKGHGKKARHGGKTVVVRTQHSAFSAESIATYPTAVLGLAGRRTFFESRLIFGTSDTVTMQASLGLRW
jgi:hypothetical protein